VVTMIVKGKGGNGNQISNVEYKSFG